MILFCASGHGHFDLPAYADYLAGNLVDHEHPEQAIQNALNKLPNV